MSFYSFCSLEMFMSATRLITLCVLVLGFGLMVPASLNAQSSLPAAVVMVEIQCRPGAADRWQDSFTKEILPAIREAIQKGDVLTNFSYFEAPLPAQNVDFILLYEM